MADLKFEDMEQPEQPTPPAPRQRRRLNFGAVLLVGISTPLAILTLLGLERFQLLPDSLNNGVGAISQILIQLITIVGAVALVVGVLNLLRVNLRNVSRRGSGLYSIFTLLTLVIIIVVRIVERFGILTVANTTTPAITLTLMDAIQVAIESALAGILFFFLVYAAYRMMRRRVTLWSVLFVAALVIVLVGYIPLTGMDFLATFREWLLRVPVGAGMRGLLIGIAIGTVTVGVRVLIGQDRTFRD